MSERNETLMKLSQSFDSILKLENANFGPSQEHKALMECQENLSINQSIDPPNDNYLKNEHANKLNKQIKCDVSNNQPTYCFYEDEEQICDNHINSQSEAISIDHAYLIELEQEYLEDEKQLKYKEMEDDFFDMYYEAALEDAKYFDQEVGNNNFVLYNFE